MCTEGPPATNVVYIVLTNWYGTADPYYGFGYSSIQLELMHKPWLDTITSFFLVIYCVLSWHEWERAGLLYGNLNHA